MKRNLYVIMDNVALTIIGPVIIGEHDAPMIRQFRDALTDPESALAKHAEDYTLLLIGDINDANGEIGSTFIPEVIARGRDVIAHGIKETTNG